MRTHLAAAVLALCLPATAARHCDAAEPPAAARILSVANTTQRDPTVDSLLATIGAWADAWSNKDLPRYLAFYSEQFQSENRESRNQWQATRGESLRRPSHIDIRILQVRVKPWEADTYRVCFIQQYRSSTRQEANLKVLFWRREASGWRIIREQVLA